MNKFKGLDFATLELKALADSSVPKKDFHTEKAKELFGTDDPTKEQRAFAKAYNYTELYSTPFGVKK